MATSPVGSWRVTGEFVVSCNCDFFCPCMPSLGRARPTHGSCLSWFGYHVETGEIGETRVRDRNVAMMLHVPGRMEEGGWTTALYLDHRATDAERAGLASVLGGRAGGPIGWFSLMIAEELPSKVVEIRYTNAGREWRFEIPKILEGTIEADAGLGADGLVRITNTRYWMTPEIVMARGKKSRFRDHGRNWNLSGQSAEYGRFDWSGP
jgi:hypothetical protein